MCDAQEGTVMFNWWWDFQ